MKQTISNDYQYDNDNLQFTFPIQSASDYYFMLLNLPYKCVPLT